MSPGDTLLVMRMTRHVARSFGLLMCGNCGWPENNHFEFGQRLCAHDESCEGFSETARRGIELVPPP